MVDFMRPFRFSIRSMLLAVTLLAVICGWWAHRRMRAKAEAAFALRCEQEGIRIRNWLGRRTLLERSMGLGEDWSGFADTVAVMSWSTATDDDVLNAIENLTDIRWFMSRSEQLSDRFLSRWERRRGLSSLSLCGDQLTDSALLGLEDCQSLRDLDLWSQHFSDRGVKVIARIPGLESLGLHGKGITDQTIEVLLELEHVTRIVLSGECQFSPTGVARLCGMKRLEQVIVECTSDYPPSWEAEDIEYLTTEFERHGMNFEFFAPTADKDSRNNDIPEHVE